MQKCVLIYDDDVEILIVCKAILEMDQYRVETSTYCENIVQDIDTYKPDLILMDLWIPAIGGERAVNLMRDHSFAKQVPVILFSANDEIEKISERINANGFLKKPFDIFIFRQTIKDHIL